MSKKSIVSIAAMCVLSLLVFAPSVSFAASDAPVAKAPTKAVRDADDDGDAWEKKVKDKIMKYLGSEGYRPKIDDDGDVTFKVEGLSYCVLLDSKDRKYFRILLPGIAKIEEGESAKAMLAGAIVCKDVKVAKVLVFKKNVHVFVELFCADEDAFIAVLDRSVSCASVARDNYYEAVKSLNNEEKTK